MEFKGLSIFFLLLLENSWGAKTVPEIMDSFFPDKSTNPNDYYDKRVRPNVSKGPVRVRVSAFVLDIYDIDEKKHEFTAQLYFRQEWTDERLVYQPPPGINYINLGAEYSEKLWTPDTFFTNERSSMKHELTVDNSFTQVSPGGEVLQSIRITVTASCPMNLKWFPFDRHICSLEFESYGYTADQFYYEWKSSGGGEGGKPGVGVSLGAGGSINQVVLGFTGTAKMLNFTADKSYSRGAIEVKIARVSTRFIQDVYFPATVLVIIAFITMSVGALQFRVLLSVICMVAIIIFSSLLSMEMPKVSYQTALDFYVFKCSFMVFNVVLVNFIMYHLLKPSSSTHTRMRLRPMNGRGGSGSGDDKDILPDADLSSEDYHHPGVPVFDNKIKHWTYTLCKYSQFSMPCFFLLFNIIYWPVVLIASNSVGSDTDFMLFENTD